MSNLPEILELRVHHVTTSARLMYQHPEAYSIAMAFQQNPADADAQFFRIANQTIREAFNNPSQKIKLTSSITNLCQSCTLVHLCQEDSSISKRDTQEADKYKLTIGKIYTSKELRELIGF